MIPARADPEGLSGLLLDQVAAQVSIVTGLERGGEARRSARFFLFPTVRPPLFRASRLIARLRRALP